MARVTVERTLEVCDNKFELVVLASYRAHAIACGSQSVVDAGNKYAVLALREIENKRIDINKLRDTVIKRYIIENNTSTSNNSFVINDLSLREAEAEYAVESTFATYRTYSSSVATQSNTNREIDDDVKLNVSADFFASKKKK